MSKRLIKHFLALVGGQMVTLANTLLLIPLFLAHWTAGTYGEWLVLSSLANYLSTLDLGMNSAVGNSLLAAYVRKDMDDYQRSQHSAIAFYLGLAVVASALMGLAAWLLPISHWAKLTHTTPHAAGWVVWLLALQVLWMMPVGLVGNIYRTMGNPAKSVLVNNAKILLFVAVTAIALLLRATMVQVAMAQLIPLVLIVIFLFWDIGRRHPEMLPGVSGANITAIKALLAPSLLFALITIGMAITQQGSVLVISGILGTVAVTTFVLSRTLTNAAMQVVNILKNAAWPDLTILHAQEDWMRLRIVSRMLVIVSGVLCIAIAGALWFEGGSVMAAWTHHKVHVPLLFFRLMLLYLVMQTAWMASSALLVATNQHRNLSWSYLASGIIGVGLAAVGVHLYGLAAAPVGLMIGEAIACYHFVVRDSCAAVREPYGPFALRVWGVGAVVLCATLAVGAGLHHIEFGPAPVRWMEVGAGTLLTSATLGWFIWLTGEEKDSLRRKFGGLKSKFPVARGAGQVA